MMELTNIQLIHGQTRYLNHMLYIWDSMVVKADATHTSCPDLISGADRKNNGSFPPPLLDRIDVRMGLSINQGSLYHCTLWASKRSLKVGQDVGLLDVLGKLY